jgi:hypothetical protein
MTKDAEHFLAHAMKTQKLTGSFAPIDLGAKIGLSKMSSTIAARELADGGVFVLGFDGAAHFSPEFRKLHSKPEPKAARKKKRPHAGAASQVGAK